MGTIKGNQHLKFENQEPIANLQLTLLQRAGIAIESHGDSTGTFEDV